MSAKLLLRLALAAAFVFLFFSIACQQQATPPTNQSAMTANDSKAWDSYVNDFIETYFVAHPDFAVHAGRHEFDGKLPDWSAAGIKQEIQRLHSERDRAAGFKDESLDERQRFEREYVIAQIDKDLFW